MAKEDKSSKMLTIILAIVISIAAIVVLYVNLPQDNTKDDTGDTNGDGIGDNESEEPAILLTVIYNNTEHEYTLEELENLTSVTGTGRRIKTKLLPDTILIEPDLDQPVWEFTGVPVSTLVNKFENIPENYTIMVTGSDDWTVEYTKSNVTGTVDIYNETGEITGTNGSTMILAYKQDNEYISEEYGPLRIAFIDNDVITDSSLWAKWVVTIEIVEE